MKRLVGFMCLLLASPLAAEFALVYKSADDVKKTAFSPGLATTEGITVSAAGILAAGENMMAGLQGQELHKASLIRFDNDLNLALIRLGDRVTNDALQAAHKKNSDKTTLFLPELGQVTAVSAGTSSTAMASGEPFVIRLNQKVVGAEPVQLLKKRKKADVLFEVVGQNMAESTWRLTVDAEADPRLSFWKKGDTKGLNAIPTRTLHYSHQILFRPFSNGSSLKIPIEIHNIKEENYELKVKVASKSETFETKIPIQFVDK